MATILTHPAIAFSLSSWGRFNERHGSILIFGMILTILPDIDVIGFKLGIPYLHLFGHRGFTHSIFFAASVSGLVSWWLVRKTTLRLSPVWLYLFICIMSHGMLDAMTNGGQGIAFLSPFSNQRFFFPFRPINVSPLSIKPFLEGRGYQVLGSEVIWVWLPGAGLYLSGLLWRWSLGRLYRPQQEIV